jgi:hypothetical protein
MNGRRMFLAATALLTALGGNTPAAMDPDNPTCTAQSDWSANRTMKLTPVVRDGETVLLAEGVVDAGLPERLKQALVKNPDVAEIWLRSPGGNAVAGNQAGLVIRQATMPIVTRIPAGWTCFSACNFVFMGGRARIIEPGGQFMVHMFTMTGDRDAIDDSVSEGSDATVALIGEIEQESAMLASEDNDFLIRMGVSRKLLTDIMYKQKAVKTGARDKSTRRCLTTEEALRYNVANVSG